MAENLQKLTIRTIHFRIAHRRNAHGICNRGSRAASSAVLSHRQRYRKIHRRDDDVVGMAGF